MKTELKAVSNQSNQELATLANCAAAWKGDELLNSTYWNYQLTSVEVWEIEAAIRNLNHPQNIDNSDIQFNQFSKTLAKVSEELENGKGAVLLKGVPVDRYSEEEIAKVYLAMCKLMGTPIRESNSDFDSPRRNQTQFITYIRAEAADSTQEGKQSNDAFKLHTDRCDARRDRFGRQLVCRPSRDRRGWGLSQQRQNRRRKRLSR